SRADASAHPDVDAVERDGFQVLDIEIDGRGGEIRRSSVALCALCGEEMDDLVAREDELVRFGIDDDGIDEEAATLLLPGLLAELQAEIFDVESNTLGGLGAVELQRFFAGAKVPHESRRTQD